MLRWCLSKLNINVFEKLEPNPKCPSSAWDWNQNLMSNIPAPVFVKARYILPLFILILGLVSYFFTDGIPCCMFTISHFSCWEHVVRAYRLSNIQTGCLSSVKFYIFLPSLWSPLLSKATVYAEKAFSMPFAVSWSVRCFVIWLSNERVAILPEVWQPCHNVMRATKK